MNLEEKITIHFEKKMGDKVEVLRERYEQILSFHEDRLSAALLATSFYGMEELKMRLPRINEIMRNPFGEGELLHAVTGLIMLADGGPAEGAKAMQMYLPLMMAGISCGDVRQRHLLALLAIVCDQARPLAEMIQEELAAGSSFEEFAIAWIRRRQLEE